MGLLQQQAQPQPQQPQPQQAQQPQRSMQKQPNSEMVDMNQARGDMGGMMDKLKRLVLAGQTILYDAKTAQGFLKYLDEQAIPQSVAEITGMVMAALIDKSNASDKQAGKPEGTTCPPKLVVPAGALIANDLLDYACKLFEVEMNDDLAKQTLSAFAETMQRGVAAGAEQPGQQQPGQAQALQSPEQQFAQQQPPQAQQGVM